MAVAGASEQSKLRVFISYSRKDEDFAQELLAGLVLAGFEPYLDKHGIAAGEDWEARLGRLIEAADTVVFVISPDSVASERCAWEVDSTVTLKKRLLPIVWRRVEETQVPLRLKQPNYIYFDRPLKFVPSLTELASALRTDLDWIREHTQIGEAALRWQGRGRAEALLSRGEELAAAKVWLSAPPQFAPEPTLLHHEFIRAGEDAEAARSTIERQRLDQMAAGIEREKAAQAERENALAQAQAALRKAQRARMMVIALMLSTIAGLLGVIFKEPIGEFIFEQTTVRNFIAAQVRNHVLAAEAERALKPGSTFRECAKACPERVVVPAGSFRMGSIDNEPGRYNNESPVHTVTFARAFAVGKFEVTSDDWEACVAMRGCDGRPTFDATFGKGQRPVINVSWVQATSYVEWLSRMTGKPYRLLTEVEWEYAARGGMETTYSFGNYPADLCKHANIADTSFKRFGYKAESFDCDDGHAQTALVGNYSPNPFGLYDLHLNVWERVQDCSSASYKDALTDGSALPVQYGCSRVVRGGSWTTDPRQLRVARRYGDRPDNRAYDIGFRVGRALLP